MTVADAVLVAVGAGGLVLSIVAALTGSIRTRLSAIDHGVAGLYDRIEGLNTRLSRMEGSMERSGRETQAYRARRGGAEQSGP